VIGYPGIQPKLSAAAPPADWYREQGEETLLWGGWKQDVGHRWFRAGRGDVELGRISSPMGGDVAQAIDYPLTESSGGKIWGRIPDEANVVASRLGEVETAYPLLVLDKVSVVNDEVGGRWFLVAYSPFVRGAGQVAVYDPAVEGRRVTMGSTGYFHDGLPMLYDRGTESLWVADPEGLKAVSGAHKGRRMRQVARPALVTWSRWRDEHPSGRLVIGADRSRGRPDL
jgi:hypothetical protein